MATGVWTGDLESRAMDAEHVRVSHYANNQEESQDKRATFLKLLARVEVHYK